MSELHEIGIHTSVAGFVGWLARAGTPPALRHAYPSAVGQFLRWRHSRLLAGEDCDREHFMGWLRDHNAPYHERQVASDAIGHYVRFLTDEPS